jgi:iron complex transport system substrate-binding protein
VFLQVFLKKMDRGVKPGNDVRGNGHGDIEPITRHILQHAPIPSPPDRLSHRGTVETLYLLGEQDRIVGVSGYAVRPPQVSEKPRVSAFISADIPKILALDPDLVLAFSDLQAGIVFERDIAGILAMIRALGALVGVSGARRATRNRL